MDPNICEWPECWEGAVWVSDTGTVFCPAHKEARQRGEVWD